MKNSVKRNGKNCILLLDDGTHLLGSGRGYNGDFIGEICFNTSITGYQEILTDPSYFNQIINFTFPHIGIVGTNKIDYESSKIYASACIANNKITEASNYRSEINFEKWLINNKKACITGVDTRILTKKIRDGGACNALIHFPKNKIEDIRSLKKILGNFPKMKNQDLASKVSTKSSYLWKKNTRKTVNFNNIEKKFIAVIDFGIKKNILNILENTGLKIVVFPIDYPYKKIISLLPLGIFFSNGPGDPNATFLKKRKELESFKNQNIPIFGICLGHQILSLLFGAKTEKMHNGHRGANHPIKNISNEKVEITVQNHGFVVSKNKLPKNIDITHTSLFDGTIAGIKIKDKPFFSVQYHPEASPGPQDSRYLFNYFHLLIKDYAKKNRY